MLFSKASIHVFIMESKIYKSPFFSATAHAYYPRKKAKERAGDLHSVIIRKVGSHTHGNAVLAKAIGDGDVLFN